MFLYVGPCWPTPALRITRRRKRQQVIRDTWPLWAASSGRPATGRASAGNHIIRSAWRAHHGHSVMQLTKGRFFFPVAMPDKKRQHTGAEN